LVIHTVFFLGVIIHTVFFLGVRNKFNYPYEGFQQKEGTGISSCQGQSPPPPKDYREEMFYKKNSYNRLFIKKGSIE